MYIMRVLLEPYPLSSACLANAPYYQCPVYVPRQSNATVKSCAMKLSTLLARRWLNFPRNVVNSERERGRTSDSCRLKIVRPIEWRISRVPGVITARTLVAISYFYSFRNACARSLCGVPQKRTACWSVCTSTYRESTPHGLLIYLKSTYVAPSNGRMFIQGYLDIRIVEWSRPQRLSRIRENYVLAFCGGRNFVVLRRNMRWVIAHTHDEPRDQSDIVAIILSSTSTKIVGNFRRIQT